MTSPLKTVTNALGFNKIESAFNRFTTLPGTGAAVPPPPTTPPPLAPDATTPTAKTKPKGIQQSFLSGVAASALGGQAGSSGGKTLLGS